MFWRSEREVHWEAFPQFRRHLQHTGIIEALYNMHCLETGEALHTTENIKAKGGISSCL